jgi:uncharacterized membrane protein
MPNDHPLDVLLSEHGLTALERTGVLSPQARESMVLSQLGSRKLAGDANRLLLGLGAALLISSGVVFFTLNWDRLGTLLQLALPQLLIAGCLVGVWRKGLQSTAGQLCLLAASIFVGVWLAVFGVVFRSDRDAFFLFLSWAVLIAPWVLASRFAPLWLVWLAVLNAALGRLFNMDDLRWHWWWSDSQALGCLSLGVLNAAGLAARERAVARGTEWLADRYSRIIVLLGVLAAFSWASLISIDHLGGFLLFATVQAVVLGALLWVYVRVCPDFLATALTALDACLLCVFVTIRLLIALFEQQGWRSELAAICFFGLSGVVTLSAFAMTATRLKNLYTVMQKGPGNGPARDDV